MIDPANIVEILTCYKESLDDMKNIITTTLMLPGKAWSKEQFLKSAVLKWFLQKGISIKEGNGYITELPIDWEIMESFYFLLNGCNLHFLYHCQNDSICMVLDYTRTNGENASRSIVINSKNLLEPSAYNPDNCIDLILSYNHISYELGKQFLGPFIVPLSQGIDVRSH